MQEGLLTLAKLDDFVPADYPPQAIHELAAMRAFVAHCHRRGVTPHLSREAPNVDGLPGDARAWIW